MSRVYIAKFGHGFSGYSLLTAYIYAVIHASSRSYPIHKEKNANDVERDMSPSTEMIIEPFLLKLHSDGSFNVAIDRMIKLEGIC